MTVRIHDNFIHHNQHQRKHGYGVSVGNGAHALIEKNVFDWNRHAIAGDGSDRSGYLAYRNLVLENGGLTLWLLGTWAHTHMFDMHGQDDCWLGDRNCGVAGEYMDIRYNTFLYSAGHAFRLRGTPSIRADVRDNVFKHESLWGVSTPYETLPGAVTQSESGLVTANNQLGVDESGNLGHCDFDADGAMDTFFATGATWWYSSGGTAAWRYLNTSSRRLSQLTLGDVDGDGRCDVRAGRDDLERRHRTLAAARRRHRVATHRWPIRPLVAERRDDRRRGVPCRCRQQLAGARDRRLQRRSQR